MALGAVYFLGYVFGNWFQKHGHAHGDSVELTIRRWLINWVFIITKSVTEIIYN